MDTAVILTSAAVGAIVSSIVTVTSQFFDRRVRRDELLIKAATELAIKHADFVINAAEKTGRDAVIPPHGWLVYDFYRQLRHLMRYHELPRDIQKSVEDYYRQIEGLGG